MYDRVIGFRFPTEAEIPLISVQRIGNVIEDPSSITGRGKRIFSTLHNISNSPGSSLLFSGQRVLKRPGCKCDHSLVSRPKLETYRATPTATSTAVPTAKPT